MEGSNRLILLHSWKKPLFVVKQSLICPKLIDEQNVVGFQREIMFLSKLISFLRKAIETGSFLLGKVCYVKPHCYIQLLKGFIWYFSPFYKNHCSFSPVTNWVSELKRVAVKSLQQSNQGKMNRRVRVRCPRFRRFEPNVVLLGICICKVWFLFAPSIASSLEVSQKKYEDYWKSGRTDLREFLCGFVS